MTTTVGVAGLGLLGRGIVTCLLAHGFRVVAVDPSADSRAAAREHVAHGLDDLVERGGFPSAIVGEWPTRYSDGDDVAAFADCDFVIESIFENLAAKQALFDRIEAVVGPRVPIASNTSALPISTLQSTRRNPERFVGTHWAEPCHVTRFLEVIRGDWTDEETARAALDLGKRCGKDPTLVKKDTDGFIVNRLGYAMFREAFWLLENGVADVESIDRAFRNALSVWANIAGPFRWMDLTGVPAYAAVMERMFPKLSKSDEVPETIKALVARGATGIASGEGFYRYTPEEARRWHELLVDNVWRARAMQDEVEAELKEVRA